MQLFGWQSQPLLVAHEFRFKQCSSASIRLPENSVFVVTYKLCPDL